MKLILSRNQKSGVVGGIKFILTVRADISPQEQEWIKKYKMGDTVLYQSLELLDKGSGLLGIATRLAYKAMNIQVSVKDLASGRSVECKDIVEMLAVEEQIRVAAETFKAVLNAAAHFGGEEVVDI